MAEAKKQDEVKDEAVVDSKEEKPHVTKTDKAPETVAKAGKRSAKAVKEAEEKQAKEERKAKDETTTDAKPKKQAKPARSRLERRGKKYQETVKDIDKTKEYTLEEAIKLAKKTSTTKFDATVELHARLNVDPKQADQNIRGTVVLPAGSGKTARVAVFAEADDVKQAKAAGADIAESDEFLQKLDKEQIDFDVLIATPKMMAKLGKYARVLGPKGLMPNPKSGTVTTDVAKAVKESKGGKVEYRVDSAGIIHLGVGKVSFSEKELQENLDAVLSAIKAAKPGSIKGALVQSIYLTTSMGPSIKVAPTVI